MDVRVRLRPWLESRLNEGWIEGLCWVDQEKGIFRIPWKHHSKHTWTEQDAAIFKDWAVVTGRYREGIDDPDWPMWKTRLRCALNKAPDIQEVKQRHNLHCDDPFKVYRFISKTESLWRANATRNASMIFDGLPSLGQLPTTFNVHSYSARRSSNTSAAVHQRRPTILISRLSSLARNDSAPYQNKPLAIVRRRDQLFVKKLSLRSLLPSSSQVQAPPLLPQHIHSVNTGPLDSLDVGAVQEVFSSPSPQFSGLHSIPINSPSIPVLHPPSFLPLLPDIMEPEFHQLGVRIQHLNIRVRDAIVTNPNGCCIYFGRFDEVLASNPATDTADSISITSSPDAIEMAITHNVADENRAYVDMLLSNMTRGIIVTASSNDGSIYVRRLCRCAVFIYYLNESVGDYVLVKKVFRRECFKIFDYSQFAAQLEYYRLGQGSKPYFEVVLAFGQQLRPGLSTQNLLVWCRVASCRAWFQVQRVISGLKTPECTFPLSVPGSLNSNQSMLVGDEVSPMPTDDIDICVPDADGVEISLYSPPAGIKLESEEVEEEVVVSTSLGDVTSSALIDSDHGNPPVDGEVITEVIEEEVVEMPQEESLLTNLAAE
ncbi:Interferon regulatory factor 4 [Echinococcus granulosus]|nr:Interferon regulatory factor 4 [Echinococcus granulosus]CDS21525.1 interferon regulatory factor [Echinococcus granulosus]